jgi:DNA-binding NarL/FixJ family response regulator
MPANIVIADSSDLIRIGLRTILSKGTALNITGEVKDNAELIEHCRSFSPDLIMIDYTTKGFSIDIIPKVLQFLPTTRVIAVTHEQSGQVIVNALRAGVVSHIKKDCDMQEIVDCVRETSLGNKFFCGKILEIIQKENIDLTQVELEEFTCEAVTISERELEIIQLIAEGYTNQQIADKLVLSAHTINTHRKNIMSKLGVKNTAGIVMYAVKSELVSPNKFLFAAQS